MFNKMPSGFVYVAQQHTHGFGLDRRYIRDHIDIEKYMEEMNYIRSKTRRCYTSQILNPIMKHRRINIESILSLTNRKFTFEFIKKDYAAYALSNNRDKLKSHLIKTLRQHYNIMNREPIDDAIISYNKLFNTI